MTEKEGYVSWLRRHNVRKRGELTGPNNATVELI